MVKIKPKVKIREKVPQKMGTKALIPIIVILVAVLLIGGFFLLKPRKDNPVAVSSLDSTQIVNSKVNTPDSTLKSDIETSEAKTITDKNNSALSSDDTKKSDQSEKNETSRIQIKEQQSTVGSSFKKGETYKIYQFQFGKSDYSQSNLELDNLIVTMKNEPSIKISISAYTDKVGDASYNKLLSENRAKAIRDYLVSKGIENSRLRVIGKGISTKYPTDAENRRAEFEIIN